MTIRSTTTFQNHSRVTFQLHAASAGPFAIQFVDRNSHEPLGPPQPLRALPGNTHELQTTAQDGDCYFIQYPDGTLRPDPTSRFQPAGVHGPSQLVDHRRYDWQDAGWKGVAKRDLIVYELHIGTFTEAGTYAAAESRLAELSELGVTAIELMPLSQAAGDRNWGYDGVNFFAPRNTYGSPDELKRFVDTAHGLGFAILLDVVYNHFGPEGNYLHDLGGYVSKRHSTAWGDALNFDGRHRHIAREFVIANALYWIEAYHFDGLRLDAIHCMHDESDVLIVTEIGAALDRYRPQCGRELHLIAESNIYDPELLQSLDAKGHGFDAIWCDDFIHSIYATLRPGDHKSDREYLPESDLRLVMKRGFVFEGTMRSPPSRIAEAPDARPADFESLIFAIQNHDFIGNYPEGLRLHQLASHEAQRAAVALLLLFPAIPMLFMGEEFASDNPFLFFADFGDHWVRTSVEEGRRREYPHHAWTTAESPLSDTVFHRSRIGNASDGDQDTLAWYRRLIKLRKQWIAAGALRSDRMMCQWEAHATFASIVYQDGTDSLFVMARLHPTDSHPDDVALHLTGDLILSQQCEFVDKENVRLGPFGVVIGTGEWGYNELPSHH